MTSSDDQTILALPPLGTGDGRVDFPKISLETTEEINASGETGSSGAAIGKAIGEAIVQIMKNIEKDDEGRRKFTQGMVSTLRQTFPHFNWICVHTSHEKSFDGKEGEDWGRGHGDFDLKIGSSVGYEIYYCRSGIFSLHGDGGYLNWAWIGNITTQSGDGRIILFRRP